MEKKDKALRERERAAQRKAKADYLAERKKIKSSYERLLAEQEERGKNPPSGEDTAFLSLRNVEKVYPNFVHAVHSFSLDVNREELIVFLGPSGCGKSTTLRMIAGLEDITSGDLFIDGRYSNEDSPKKRGVSMVFQNYALYPHMSVYDNIAFGLQVARLPKEEIDAKVRKTAEILQIGDYLDRKPRELSGGQRQRVALGRAIARDAKVFLMDEPLSNLDAKLRVSMRSEIIRLHRKIKATTIYVTHDQSEAMTMADRIVVMKDGYIQQVGTPEEIYDHPANTFVASFIGSPAMNLIPAAFDPKAGTVAFANGCRYELGERAAEANRRFYQREIERIDALIERESYLEPDLDSVLTYHKEPFSFRRLLRKKKYPHIKTPEEKKEALIKEKERYESRLSSPHEVVFGIRPEDIHISGEKDPEFRLGAPFETDVELSELLGSEYHLHILFASKGLLMKAKNTHNLKSAARIEAAFDLAKAHLFDPDNERAIF